MLLVLGSLLVAGSGAAVDLEGEWYVLVHFEERAREGEFETDTAVEGWPADALEAEAPVLGVDYRDEVWRFALVGDELRWTIFPGLAFHDETGRFEDIRGQRARLRHAWRPSLGQLEEIRAGVDVDERTARSKTLRRRGHDGFASGAPARAGSASAVAFGEHWSVQGVEAEPEFSLAASLSSGRTDALEGATRFTADSVDAGAGRIEGAYSRDGTATGRFYMWKKGEARADDAAFAAAPDDGSLFGPGGAARSSVVSLQALVDRLDAPRAREDAALRVLIRESIRQLIEDSFARQRRPLREHAMEIEALTGEIERLCVVEGVALEEIDRRYAAGELRP